MKPILFSTDMVKAILDKKKTATRRAIKGISKEYYCEEVEVNPCVISEGGRKEKQLSGTYAWFFHREYEPEFTKLIKSQYQVGDVLYVKETWCRKIKNGKYAYKADKPTEPGYLQACYDDAVWHPSIHMPKSAARIFLKVTNVRVERLQDITEEEAIKEGVVKVFDYLSKDKYEDWAKRVGENISQKEQPYSNYLWHGHFGHFGMGNKVSDAWNYQYSGYDKAMDSFSSLWNSTFSLQKWDKYGWDSNPWVFVYEFERCEKPEEEA